MKSKLVSLLAFALAFAFVGPSAPSTAFGDKLKARDHFRKGMAKYTLEKYEEAIVEFEQGYTEESDPAFLYNIAQSHRLAGRPKVALDFYRKYLLRKPDAPNRKEIEDQIAALEKSTTPSEAMGPSGTGGRPVAVQAKPQPVAITPKPAPVVVKPKPEPVAITPKPAPVVVAPEPRVAMVTPQPAPDRADEVPPGARPPTDEETNRVEPPVKKRRTWPIWVGVIGGVVVAGGAATAVVLATRTSTTILPAESAR